MYLLLFILASTFVGCTGMQIKPAEPVKVETRTSTIPVFHPPLPDAPNFVDVKYEIWTPDRMREYLKDLEAGKAVPMALYVLTAQGYENVAGNIAEVKRVLKQYRAVVIYYRKNVNNMAAPEMPKEKPKTDK